MEEILKVLDKQKEERFYNVVDSIQIEGYKFVFDVLETDTVGGCWEYVEYAEKVDLYTVNNEKPTDEVSKKFQQLVEESNIILYLRGEEYDRY